MTTEVTALAVIETIDAIDLFNPEVITPKLNAIRTQVIAEARALDISTPGNRSALASLAFSVGKMKTFVDKQRLAIVGPRKAELKKIDTVGSSNWDFLEALQKEVRKPLTDWEDADKLRVATHEAELKEIETAGATAMQTWNAFTAEAIRDRMKEIESDDLDYQEFTTKHAQVKAYTLKQMSEALAKREAYEAEQVELARLRAESAAREQKEREDRIAREATEAANRAATEREEKASREVQESVTRHQREKSDAEARIAKAEQDAKAAAECAEREKVEAVAAEQKRVADAKAAEESATKAREKDKAHKAEVNSNALAALVTAGLSHEDAKKAITAIAKGLIPSVKVVY